MSDLLWTASPLAVLRHFQQYRYLIGQLARRELELRYRGSYLGLTWSLLTPLIMLAVYTFVFSMVLQVRWGDSPGENRSEFALALFAGLCTFQIFAETITAAPELILAHRNYVKRVVFPLEVLPVARFLANLVHAGLSFLILVLGVAALARSLPWTVALLPVVLVPLCLLSLGAAYFLSSLGVFVRDTRQAVGPLTTILLFMSAIFYPASRLPPAWQSALQWNPLVPIIADVRRVILEGAMPDWPAWGMVTLLSSLVFVAGLAWFMKSKNAFADVL